MGAQAFLLVCAIDGPDTVDPEYLGEIATVVYEFDDYNGPRRWDVLEWADEVHEERELEPTYGYCVLKLDASDLSRLRNDLATRINDPDDEAEGWEDRTLSDKARRIRLDDEGISTAVRHLQDEPNNIIYLYTSV